MRDINPNTLSQRLRSVLRSLRDQLAAGELTEERFLFHLRQIEGVADTLDVEAAARRDADGAVAEVVDLAERRALEAAVPGRDPADLHFNGMRPCGGRTPKPGPGGPGGAA